MLHIHNVYLTVAHSTIQAQAYRKQQKQTTALCVCLRACVVGACVKLAERGHMQLIGFLLPVTDGYLLGVHVVRKCYANLRGRGGGGTKFVETQSTHARKFPEVCTFPLDESFGRTSVNRNVTVVL
jgi:hypothetical protein